MLYGALLYSSTIAAFSSAEELILHIMAKEYNAKTKGIFFRNNAEG